jgi:hypothetical protein
MSEFNNITEFNTYLSKNLKKLQLDEYFNLIHSHFYSNLDIIFMGHFLLLTEHENEFIVDFNTLQEYEIINTIKSSDIKLSLNNLSLTKNEDYKLINNEYKLTPFAFKLCLIRSKKTKKYAKYYLLLEQIYKHYNDYKFMYQNVLLTGKDKRIKEMKEQIKGVFTSYLNKK